MMNANTLHLQKLIPPPLCDNGFCRSELVERPINNVNWELARRNSLAARKELVTCSKVPTRSVTGI